MTKTSRFQNTIFVVLLAWSLFYTANVLLPEASTEPIPLPQEKSEIPGEENPEEREQFETQMLVDPKTGVIPPQIRSREVQFSRTIPGRSALIPRSAAGQQATEETSQFGTWRSRGPVNIGGRTRALAIDRNDDNLLLAGGVSGAMWRSTNRGTTWENTTNPASLHSISALVQGNDDDTWYYGTGELRGNSASLAGGPFRGDGIFKSTDGGQTWNRLLATVTDRPDRFNSPFNYAWNLAVDHTSPTDNIYAAVFGGVVRSLDGGATWETVLGEDLISVDPNSDLNGAVGPFYTDIHITSDGTFYASMSFDMATSGGYPLAGYYTSPDGENWTIIRSLGEPRNRRTVIGSAPSDPSKVYFLRDNVTTHFFDRYEPGVGFTDLSANIPRRPFFDGLGEYDSQGSYDMYIKVHPTDPNLIFMGGTNIYRSTDGFTTPNNTTWIGGYALEDDGSVYENHHPDQHNLVFLNSNPDQMITANDGGVFITQDNRADEVVYTSLNNGYLTTQYYTVDLIDAVGSDIAVGGLQDNGSLISITDSPEANAARGLGGDGGYAFTTRFGVYFYFSFQRSQILRLTFNSNLELTSFARVDPVGGGSNPDQPYLFINPFRLDPNNNNRMYLAGGDMIWRNRNLSQIPSGSQQRTSVNWSPLGSTLINLGQISALDVSTEPANVVYYASSTGDFRRIDNANSPEYMVEDLRFLPMSESTYISSVSVDPTNAEHVMVTVSNYEVPSVYVSFDGGTTFADISGNLEESPTGGGAGPSVRWGQIIPLTEGYRYVVGTSTGLYSTESANGSSTFWVREAENEIGNRVVSMFDYRRSDGKLVVATHGSGLFSGSLSNVLPESDKNFGTDIVLSPSFPNPFDQETTVRFTLPETAFVTVRVYNSSGHEVKVLARGLGFEGENEIVWDGTNVVGQPVPPGVYLVRIASQGNIKMTKLILSRF